MSHNHYLLNHEWISPVTIKSDGTWLIDRKYDDPYNLPIPGNYAILAPSTNPYSMYNCSAVPALPSSGPLLVPQQTAWAAADAQIYWCAMKAVRPSGCTDPANVTTCDKHYQSDYEVEDTVDGFLAIDKFRQPEPLTSIYMAVNSSLRRLAAKATAMDKIAILPFADKIYGPMPPTGLSRDLDLMIDLTDMRRAGKRVFNTTTGQWQTVGKEHPNYIDRGWSPVDIAEFAVPDALRPKKGTDLLAALNQGITRLSNPAFCGKRARKTLVVATDGIMNIYYPISGSTVIWATPEKIRKKQHLDQAEDLLFADTSIPENILTRLIQNDIHFVPMLVGDAIEPNFANVLKPSTVPTPVSAQYCYAKLSGAQG